MNMTGYFCFSSGFPDSIPQQSTSFLKYYNYSQNIYWRFFSKTFTP